jgi:hypothetical protein
MTRNELDYLTALHASLFGALRDPAKQDRNTSEERPSLAQKGLRSDQGEAGAASPTPGDKR